MYVLSSFPPTDRGKAAHHIFESMKRLQGSNIPSFRQIVHHFIRHGLANNSILHTNILIFIKERYKSRAIRMRRRSRSKFAYRSNDNIIVKFHLLLQQSFGVFIEVVVTKLFPVVIQKFKMATPTLMKKGVRNFKHQHGALL